MPYLDTLYQKNFIEYASYVVKDRAIPHIDDGLKPVQRRILHALFEMDDGKFHKVANVVGQAMKYHPHGDAAICAALVILANKNMFIERQGNFGNIYTGDMAAAARYIECRLTPLAREVLYNPELTQYLDSYDGRNEEPLVFPAKIPVLLAQGAEGIAVGMATRILPHNLVELLQAQVAYLEDKPFHLCPDFPTGGQVDVSEYDDGNGKVRVRARLDSRESKRIVIREIPYGTTTESLIASIEEAARKNKVKISSIYDYTAEEVEIELKLARGVYAREVIDALYAFTDCEVSISTSMMLIDADKPNIKSVTSVLQHNVDRLVDILKVELQNEARRLQDRLHAKTLEQIFIANRIYKAIEEVSTAPRIPVVVLEGLEPFAADIDREVTREDVDALLTIPIRRISLYDLGKAEKEMQEIRKRLKEIETTLAAIIPYTIAFLERLVEKHGSEFPRKTEVVSFAKVDVREAANRELELRYDRKTGYLGCEVEGRVLFEVSQYDRVLVMRKDGTYSVTDAPGRLFVGKELLHCGFVDKNLVFTVIFKERNGHTFIKRCRIDKFILNRTYGLVPEDCKVLKLTTRLDRKVVLDYKPKPRLRVLRQEFSIAEYPVRGLRAGGIRISTRELKSCRFV